MRGGLTRRCAVGGGLALVLFGALRPDIAPAEGQQVIRFGVQALQASDPEGTGPASPSPQPSVAPRDSRDPALSGAPGAWEDARLARMLPRLRKLFRYREYRTLANLRREGPLGVRQRFSIPGNCSLEVTPERIEDRGVQMRVLLREGDQVGLNAGILASPGTPAIFGGLTQGDRALIIILLVSPSGLPPSGQR